MEKSPYKLNLLHCRQNHNLFMNMKWKGNGKNKENAVKLIVHSITRRGEMWRGGGGVKWRDGGGGAAPLYQLISGLGEMVWQYIYFPTLIKKGTFTYSDSNPGDSRNQKMWRCCSQIASDYMKSCINPLRLVSAPPPPPFTSSAPCFSGFGPYRQPRYSYTWYTGVSQNNFLWQK